MALTILNEQYPPRKPKLTLTADSLDELPTEGVAEGSTATVGGTEYSYDSNAGWIVPGEGGGGSGGGLDDIFVVHMSSLEDDTYITDKTLSETLAAGKPILIIDDSSGLWSVGTPFDDDTSISASKVTCFISGQSVLLDCLMLDWDESGITVNGAQKTIP